MSGSPAFQSNAFQTGKRGSTDTPAFQGDLATITVDAGSSISGGIWTKGQWRKFVAEIEAEKTAESRAEAARVAKQEAEIRAALEAERFEYQRQLDERRRQSAEQGKALAAHHSIESALAAQQGAEQMRVQFHTMHSAYRAAQIALAKKAQDDDEEAMTLLLLHH